MVLGLAAGFFVQLVLHEGGHLAAGLAAGYGFVSFRVGSWMVIRRAGRLRLVRYRLSGTGGQCLLSPPSGGRKDSGLCLQPGRTAGQPAGLGSVPGRGMALPGAQSFLRRRPGGDCGHGPVPGPDQRHPHEDRRNANDGYNALCLRNDLAAQRAIWAQLAINAAQMEGRRLGEIPEDWFALPGGAGPDDPLKGAVWVYRYSRLVDQGRYQEAGTLREQLLAESGRLAAVHRYALEADEGLFDLLEGRTEQGLKRLNSPEIQAFCRQMKGNPGIVLVQYGAALAAGKTREAGRLRAQLEKDLEAWPYAGDAAATRNCWPGRRKNSVSQLQNQTKKYAILNKIKKTTVRGR